MFCMILQCLGRLLCLLMRASSCHVADRWLKHPASLQGHVLQLGKMDGDGAQQPHRICNFVYVNLYM